MRTVIDVVCRWICPTCNHRNPVWRMRYRRCRTDRPLGS